MNKIFSRVFRAEWEYESSFLILFLLAMVQFLESVLSRGEHRSFDIEFFGIPAIVPLMLAPILFFLIYLYRKIFRPEFGFKLAYLVFFKKIFLACLKWLLLYFIFFIIPMMIFSISSFAGSWKDFITRLDGPFLLDIFFIVVTFFILIFVAGVEMILFSIKNLRFLPIGIAFAAISWYLIPILLND